MKSLSPILALPAGKMRFWLPRAEETSDAESLAMSWSIQVHHHLRNLPPGSGTAALNRRQLRADEVLPHVEQFLFAHGVALQAKLNDGHAGGVVLDELGSWVPGSMGRSRVCGWR